MFIGDSIRDIMHCNSRGVQMDPSRIEAQSEYIAMDLAMRVINRSLSIQEAMFALVRAMARLLGKLLPEKVFITEYDSCAGLTAEITKAINNYLEANDRVPTARVIMSLGLASELVMETNIEDAAAN